MNRDRVLGSSPRSSSREEFSHSCDRCGRSVNSKGGRGDVHGIQMCKDCCASDYTFRLLASGRKQFADLKHEDIAS